jgi:hypothetical protein
MCLSRRWKADLEFSRIGIQTLASLTHLSPLNLRISFLHQSVQNQFSTVTRFQKSVVTKPYVEMSHMSNQQKAEFVSDVFHIRSFWGGHGEISPKTYFMQEDMICQKC